jgi:hypothetical protein
LESSILDDNLSTIRHCDELSAVHPSNLGKNL